MIHKDIKAAYSVLDGKVLTKELALKLTKVKGSDLMDLLSLANKVKEKYSPDMHICSITNIKSGQCSEDCKYCAQSSHYNTDIQDFPLLTDEQILKQAKSAQQNGINHFGLVSSGKGFKGDSIQLNSILSSVNRLKKEYPKLNVCLALGCLDKVAAALVSKTGIYHYNHNLQVNPDIYKTLVSRTHSIQERVDTIKNLREHNIKVCSGGIFGLGESARDRVELALALKQLDIQVIPINILVPIEGTPAYDNDPLEISEAAKSVAIFRLLHPRKILKLAAGRESVLKDFQGLFMLSGINGFLTGGYLTTRGRSVKEDKELLKELTLFNR